MRTVNGVAAWREWSRKLLRSDAPTLRFNARRRHRIVGFAAGLKNPVNRGTRTENTGFKNLT